MSWLRPLRQSFAALASAWLAAPLGAQTCASPATWTPGRWGHSTPSIVADLCKAGDAVALYCDFLDSAGKNDAIWRLDWTASASATQVIVAGTSAGFNPVVFLYTGTCAGGSGCVASGDAASPLPLAGFLPGTYFLAATAAPSDATGACGTVTLTTDGLPVQLRSFTIE